jgi:hypothetical protein
MTDGAPQSEPGIIILADDLSVVSMNGAAERWVAELPGAPPDRLAVAIYAAAAQLAHISDGVSPTTRLRTSQGQWVTIHASRLQGSHGPQRASWSGCWTPSFSLAGACSE